MQRLAPILLFVLTLFLAGLVVAASSVVVYAEDINAKEVDAPADAPKAGGAKAGRAKAPIQGGPNDKNALWWNDTGIVKVLTLTDEQRTKMGAYQKAYREKAPQDRRPDAFHETLVQGNWKDARSESEKVAKVAETAVRMRGTLKIDILSLLNKEQLQLLVDRYPRLIYKPWRRAMGEGSPR